MNTNQTPHKENLIGFASDGANVMINQNHSIVAVLRKIYQIYLSYDACVIHLRMLLYACERIPYDVEGFIPNLHMKYSNNRLQKFQ